MADSAVAVTAGTGTNIDTRTEGTNGNHRQVVVLGDPTANAGVAPVDGTAGLKVNLGADNDVTVTGMVDLGATDNAVLDSIETDTSAIAGSAATIAEDTTSIDGKLPSLGQALAAASIPVVLPAAQITTLTPPAAITGFATSAKQDTIISHVDGIETALTSIDGKITAVNTGSVTVASSALPTGAATAAKQDTIIGHVDGLEALATTIDADTSNISTKIDTLAGTVTLGKVQVDVATMPSVTVDTTGLATDAVDTSVASIDSKTPALGQALAAGSVPVVLPASQITTLTPPAAITGFATSAKQDTGNTSLATIAGAVSGGHVQADILTMPSVSVDTTGLALAANQQTDALTDAELRASAVPVSLASVPSHAVTNAGTFAVQVTSAPSTTVTATDLDIRPLVNTDVVTAELSATDNAVLDTIAAKDFATQTTLAAINSKLVTGTDIGDVTINNGSGVNAVNIQDGGNSITVDGTVAVTNAGITTIAGAVSGTEMQVDVLTMPTTTVQATNLDIRDLSSATDSILAETELTTADLDTGAGTDNRAVVGLVGSASGGGQLIPGSATDGLLVNLGANNDVTVTGNVAVTNADITTIAGAVSGGHVQADVLTLPTVTANATLSAETTKVIGTVNIAAGQSVGITANSSVNVAQMNGTTVTMGNGASDTGVQRVTIASDSTGQVKLAAGTAAIGKLTANSGVDIGDVDVLSIAAGDNNIGNVDLASAIPAGTNAIGKLLPPDIDVTAHTNYARKYYTNAGAVTDGIIWSPAAGKRWHVVTMYIQTSAAATITLEDDKAGGDDPVWKGEIAANSGVTLSFSEKYPMASGEDAADLIITTSAGNCYVTCVGYEI